MPRRKLGNMLTMACIISMLSNFLNSRCIQEVRTSILNIENMEIKHEIKQTISKITR